MLFFPNQHLEPAELVAFAVRFGELTPAHPVMPGLVGQPEVLEVDATRSRQDPRYRDEYENDTWHADVTFMPTPPLGSLLQAEVVPPAGGDTIFADLQRAYDTLSAPLRRFVDGLTAVHDGRAEFARFLASNPDGGLWDDKRFTELVPIEHPVVRTHPETGRRGLFVNPTFTTHIVGLKPLKSPAPPRVALRACDRRPNSRCAGTGAKATSRSGTTAARCTTPCAITATSIASCAASPSAVTARTEVSPA